MSNHELLELEQAYRVLGVPHSASATSIKQAYRALLKRWHPDFYKRESRDYEDATRMAKAINDAYAKIEHAPLRYHVDTPARAEKGNRRDSSASASRKPAMDADLPRLDTIEWWVRFVCGAVLGVALSFYFVLDFYADVSLRTFVLGSAVVTLGCGLGAARLGDDFWQSILARWWLWE